MASSSIPAFKAALVARLQARAALADVQVSYGPPLPNRQNESVWIGDAEGEQAWSSFGTGGTPRSEEYEVRVVFYVLHRGSTDTQKADERCFVLLAELESELRSDPSVNSTVSAASVGEFRLEEQVSEDGLDRAALLVVTVNVRHFI